MMEPVSSYYPPRSRWWSPARNAWFWLLRKVRYDRLQAALGLSVIELLLGMVVPGASFFIGRRQVFGRIVAGLYLVAGLIFLITVGFAVSTWSFGVLISLHVSSILFLLNRWLIQQSLWGRVVMSLAIVLIVSQVIYFPILGYFDGRWFRPLRVVERVVVIHPQVNVATLRRGDWVVHNTDGIRLQNLVVRPGAGIDPVLALPRDRVVFSPGSFEVNGQRFAARPHMPTSGEWLLNQNEWFIWPDLATLRQMNVPEVRFAEAFAALSRVPESRIVGRPYGRWFFRRQTL